MTQKYLYLIALMLIPILPAYATLEIYNAELNCPIESLDLTGTLIEFDFIEMCPITGNVITLNPFTDPIPGAGGEVDYQKYIKDMDTIDQIEFITEEFSVEVRSLLDILVDERLELDARIQDLKEKIDRIITKLVANIKEADTYGISDQFVTRDELNNIIREVMNAQFIIPMAYGTHFPIPDRSLGYGFLDELKEEEKLAIPNSFSVQDSMQQGLNDLGNYKKLLAQNAILDRTHEKLYDTYIILERIFVDTEIALRVFLNAIGR